MEARSKMLLGLGFWRDETWTRLGSWPEKDREVAACPPARCLTFIEQLHTWLKSSSTSQVLLHKYLPLGDRCTRLTGSGKFAADVVGDA